MKIKTQVRELKKKMNRALEVIPTKSQISVLQYVKLDVTSTCKATVTAADLGTAIVQSVVLEADQAGAFLLPADVVADMLSYFPSDEEVTIETDTEAVDMTTDKAIFFTCGRFRAKLPGRSSALFPTFEQTPETHYNISAQALKTLIERVEFAAPNKSGRCTVPSVLIESDDTKLRAVASDGFRIAVADAPGQGAGNFVFQLHKLPLPLMKDMPGAVIEFAESGNNLFFLGEGEQIITQKHNMKFPRYQRFFEETYKTEIKMPVLTLKAMLRQVCAVWDKDNPAVHMVVLGDEINISCSSYTGNSDITQKVEKTGEDNRARLNPKFILEYLKHAEGTISVNFLSEMKLLKFSNEKGDFVCAVMPLQVDPPQHSFQAVFARSSEEWKNKILDRDFDEAWKENRKGDAEKVLDPGVVPVQS